MSFILEAAARAGCASPERIVSGSSGSVSKTAPKPAKVAGVLVHTSENVPEGAFFVPVNTTATEFESCLKRSINAISRDVDYSFIFGDSHAPKRTANFDTPMDCAKAGHYKIKRHYKELDLFDISTPAGEFTISGYQLNHECPDPSM